jgi:hypothetical protein
MTSYRLQHSVSLKKSRDGWGRYIFSKNGGMMAKLIRCTLCVFVFAVFAYASGSDYEAATRQVWRIKLKLNMPGLNPAAVIWTVFEEDPVPGFKERIERVKHLFTRDIESTAGDEEMIVMANAQIRVSWNTAFRDVTGDRVYLLSGVPETAQSFSSDTKAGMKWVVTKVVFVDGKPICWAVPVETEVETMKDVKLDESNAIDLTELFNAIVFTE